MQITRSFTRKINEGNYQTFDVFSSRSLELPDDTSLEEQQLRSKELFAFAVADVAEGISQIKDIKEGGLDIQKLVAMCDSISDGRPIRVEDFEKLNENEHTLIQSVKRAYKRSPEYKGKLKPREEGEYSSIPKNR